MQAFPSPLMDLYILRHGKAGSADHSDPGDGERRLTRQGREEIAEIGAWMRNRGIKFSVIASSPLPRAMETASIIARVLGDPERVASWNELATGYPPAAVIGKINEILHENRVLLVGHEPQLSSLVSLIISDRHDCGISLKKGGIARIRFPGESGRAELLWLLPPGLIRDLGGQKK
jgi:phosphohistidine phosphatase